MIREDTNFKQIIPTRKYFKTRCELAGMKSINAETLMGHSLGLSDSYYRATELELLEDFLKVQEFLIINDENRLRKKVTDLTQKDHNSQYLINKKQNEKDDEIQQMKKEINIMKEGQKELLDLLKNSTQLFEILHKDQ